MDDDLKAVVGRVRDCLDDATEASVAVDTGDLRTLLSALRQRDEARTPYEVGDPLAYDIGNGHTLRCTYRGDCEGWPMVTFDADPSSESPIHVRPSRLKRRAILTGSESNAR
ncbi:hypothetical protein [Brevundimonas viscosa]|uniref:Uncharacterized protein n=1 Tax=Brevundimonas viscosa TaxID=871741 RepID=A0A1I6PS51_9CAUL|nr:hypothetical protein [Brevundimonas viscosa]SFS42930.1 hypothetical protein SAMN05192570_1224 [Brevundimonas viscosa]